MQEWVLLKGLFYYMDLVCMSWSLMVLAHQDLLILFCKKKSEIESRSTFLVVC